MLGPYIYECLLDIAYGDKGYYINYSGRGREDVLWQLSEYVAGRYAVPVETIANVIDRLVECELFSDGLYKRGFITSKRMQMSYFIATLGRSGCRPRKRCERKTRAASLLCCNPLFLGKKNI